MRFHRTRSNCGSCPLGGSKRIWGKGQPSGRLAFIGEAPGETEVVMNEPFVGPAGSFLNWGLANAGIARSEIYITNVSPCKYPSNDFMSFDAQGAREACEFGVQEELKYLREAGVKVLVPLGANAAHYLGLPGAIGQIRGSVYEQKGFYVIPTYHPSYFQRMAHRREDGSVQNLRVAWLYDLRKAKRIAAEGWSPPVEKFITHPDVDQVEAWCKNAMTDHALIGVDIETTGFGEHAEVVVIGLARDASNAISIPDLMQGGEYYFHNGDRMRVKLALNQLFTHCKLAFQNALFDVPVLRRKGYTIDYGQVAHDSMLLHGIITPELPHNLGFIVSIYGDTPYWKDEFHGRTGGILTMPDKQLRTYNLRDAVVLHQVLPPMLEEADELHVRHIYEQESIKLLAPIAEMCETGLRFDSRRRDEIKEDYTDKVRSLEGSLRASDLGALPDGFNFGSPDDKRLLFYGISPRKFSRLSELSDYDEATTTKKTPSGKPRTLKKATQKYQDLLALRDLHDNTPSFVLPTGWRPRRSPKTKAVKTDGQNLLSLDLAMMKRLRQLEAFKKSRPIWEAEQLAYEKQHTWLALYKEFRELKKILSTYMNYDVWSDGRIHGHLLIHGTATGRLSSRDPNLQNLPKRRKELREMFCSAPGTVFVSGDYSNLEVRVLAYTTGDEPLITAFDRGENIHDNNTRELFQLTPTAPMWEVGRRAAKVFMFGGISYGGGDAEIYERVSLQAPELGLQFKDFVQAKQRWMDAHPAYTRWAESIKDAARRTRFAEVFNGRRRELTGAERDIEKQALNTPIQGGAGAIINAATIRIYERKPTHWKFALQIHDQLIMQVPTDEAESCMALMREEMQAPVEINGVMRVFPVDFEIGVNLGQLHEPENDIDELEEDEDE